MKTCAWIFVLCSFLCSPAFPQTATHVSARTPALGTAREFSAERSVASTTILQPQSPNAQAHSWKLQATLPGAVIHDISVPSTTVGFAAAELGQVWKTTNGGATWTEVMNIGFPYYWYGIHAFSPTNVVVSGFNDSNFQGILRWSKDGGTTWSSDVVLTSDGWSFRVRFANSNVGLVMDGLNLAAANAAHVTTDG